MYRLQDLGPPRLTETYESIASELDLLSVGGMAAPARWIWVGGAGKVWVVEHGNHQGTYVELLAGAANGVMGYFEEVALGNAAKLTSSAGTYPASALGGKTMVIRLDEGTIKDTENITVTFDDTDTTQALILARINAAIAAALELSSCSLAADEGSDVSSLSSRAHGTDAQVEVVSIHADVATATGFSATTASGDATDAAEDVTVQW